MQNEHPLSKESPLKCLYVQMEELSAFLNAVFKLHGENKDRLVKEFPQ